MSMTDRAPVAEVAERARLLAAALAELPADIPTPTHVQVYTSTITDRVEISWLLFGGETGDDLDAQKSIAADVIRILGGKWEKQPDDLFEFTQRRGAVKFNVMVHREAVCTRVVTGTRKVTRTVPAPDAPTVEITETVEDVEWVCAPVLAEATA